MKTYTIGLTGDVMIGRLTDEVLTTKPPNYLWGDMLPLLQKTDVTLINLEAALTTSQKKVPKVFNFKAHPDKIQTLIEGNISVATLANNHSLDYDKEGLEETVRVLDKAAIAHVGAGKNLEEAKKPVIWEKDGFRIGILGYTDNEPSWKATEFSGTETSGTEFSGTETSGTAYVPINQQGLEEIQQDISSIRDQVDFLIVSMHWGPNMRSSPSDEFVSFARALITSGVDIFHGHSAHIFQAVEVYKNKLILYDTGDFVDDYHVDPLLRNDQSFFFLVTVDTHKIQSLCLIPTCITNCQVNRATDNEACNRMQMLSASFQTVFSLEDGTLVLQISE